MAGNTGNCSFNVYILDVTSPHVTCPDNITAYNDASANTAAVTWNSAVVTDNCCEDISLFTNISNGTDFKIGITEVTFTAVDCYGNEDQCVFSVIVEDNEPPVLECLSNQMVAADSDCVATATWMPPNVTDNSGDSFTAVCDFVSGSTLTCNATDDYDNIGYCNFTVTIYDETAPNVICPVDLEVCTDQETDSVNATWEPANATDNCCSDVNITANYTSGETLSFGVYTVGYTATDCKGNVGYCQFSVEVKDCEPPDLECPPNQNVTGDENCLANVTWTAPTVTDNSGDSFTPVCDYISGSTFYDVSTTVTCNATDNYDNTGNCTFTITIYDDEDPVINCPADIEVCAETGSIAASVTWEPINATDNCCDNVNITSDYTSGDEFEIGENVVLYTATDCSENSASCSFTIKVIDCEAPFLNCSQNVEFDADDNCTSDVTWTEVTATDNYDSDVTVFCNPTEGIFPLGNYTVTCNATDMAGNTGNCSFNAYIFDATFPDITCPEDITVDADEGDSTAAVTWVPGVVTDNCCGNDIDVVYNATNGSEFNIGVTVISLIATDCYDNQDECIFSIYVEDDEPPELECPPNQNITADPDCRAVANWTAPNVTDNSGDTLYSVCDYSSSSIFSDIITTVTCNATDGYGNTGYCSFNITIVDKMPPVLDCPNDVMVFTDTGVDSMNAYWYPANATDTCCGDTEVDANYTSGDEFTVGNTTVGYSATDCNGNTGYCQFIVTVTETFVTTPVSALFYPLTLTIDSIDEDPVQYTNDLGNQTSDGFITIAGHVSSAVNVVLSAFDDYINCEVMALSSGSIIADAQVQFIADTNVSAQDVQEELRTAAADGLVTADGVNLTVNPSSIIVTENIMNVTGTIDTVTTEVTDDVTTRITGTITPVVTDDVTTRITDTTTPVVTDDVTTHIAGTTTPVVTDDVTTHITDTTTPVVTDDVTTRLTGTTTPVATDDVTTRITDTTTPVVTDDVTTRIAGTTTPVVTDDVTTLITDTTTPVVTDDVTTRIAGTTTSVVTDDVTTHIMDTTTPVVTDDVTTRLTGTTTPVATDDVTTRITDTTTTVVADDVTTRITDTTTSQRSTADEGTMTTAPATTDATSTDATGDSGTTTRSTDATGGTHATTRSTDATSGTGSASSADATDDTGGTTDTPVVITSAPNLPTTATVSYQVTLTIDSIDGVEVDYSNDLDDHTSDRFIKYSGYVCSAIEAAINSSTCRVLAFSPGSIIADVEVQFVADTSVSALDVEEKLKIAAENGLVSSEGVSLTVDPSTISVTEIVTDDSLIVPIVVGSVAAFLVILLIMLSIMVAAVYRRRINAKPFSKYPTPPGIYSSRVVHNPLSRRYKDVDSFYDETEGDSEESRMRHMATVIRNAPNMDNEGMSTISDGLPTAYYNDFVMPYIATGSEEEELEYRNRGFVRNHHSEY
ncbi:hyalin-like isoform X2 [Anneissia japonica]|uniref:hyalin-like isoform X2 n=1 Tax=Anneissia japonica TaxID=1529436 RepID=UPI001425A7CC|nr:hyalin-like isoform X2 [Anneissia japonica]